MRRLEEILRRLSRLFSSDTGLPPGARLLTLSDGTRLLVRPIGPEDAADVDQALQALSPESRYQRFLTPVERLTPAELAYLTNPDGIDHLALGAAVVADKGAKPQPIGIARCIRDRGDSETAEVAITIADDWQRRGVGGILLGMLAQQAREAGIVRWRAVTLERNTGARALLDRIGTLETLERQGFGTVELTYRLTSNEPEGLETPPSPRE